MQEPAPPVLDNPSRRYQRPKPTSANHAPLSGIAISNMKIISGGCSAFRNRIKVGNVAQAIAKRKLPNGPDETDTYRRAYPAPIHATGAQVPTHKDQRRKRLRAFLQLTSVDSWTIQFHQEAPEVLPDWASRLVERFGEKEPTRPQPKPPPHSACPSPFPIPPSPFPRPSLPSFPLRNAHATNTSQ